MMLLCCFPVNSVDTGAGDVSHTRKMEKKLGIVSATFLVIASMLGSGILTTSGIIVSLVKTPEALLGIWLGNAPADWKLKDALLGKTAQSPS